MANYYASCRSNYFRVKDEQAFVAAMADVPDIELFNKDGFYCLLGYGESGWPSYSLDEDDNEVEIDVESLVSEHLADEEVAIFVEVGSEKLRYLGGFAVAINNKGETRSLSLDSITTLAKELGNNVTPPSY